MGSLHLPQTVSACSNENEEKKAFLILFCKTVNRFMLGAIFSRMISHLNGKKPERERERNKLVVFML